MKDVIASLYEYGVWANERLLAIAETLSDEELRRPFWQGTRSLFDDFLHLCRVDYSWFAGCSKGTLPPPAEFAVLQTIWFSYRK